MIDTTSLVVGIYYGIASVTIETVLQLYSNFIMYKVLATV